VYQEIIHDLQPDLIVETGTAYGGSALYMASVCDAVGHGQIVTIDLPGGGWPDRPEHPRISYLTGSSTDPQMVAEVAARGSGTVMVVLDSDHSAAHVLDEIRAYAPMVTSGSYLVVEDTIVNGNPVLDSFGPGPMEAVTKFLEESSEFVVDRSREKLLMTFNPSGWLRRV
jgi:cephalosporin hydroxylase